jgi:hypothetical protein
MMAEETKVDTEEKEILGSLEESLNMVAIGIIKLQRTLGKLEAKFGKDQRITESTELLDTAVVPYFSQLNSAVEKFFR